VTKGEVSDAGGACAGRGGRRRGTIVGLSSIDATVGSPDGPAHLSDRALSLLIVYALEVLVVFRSQGFYSVDALVLVSLTGALFAWQAIARVPLAARIPEARRPLVPPLFLAAFVVLGLLRPIATYVRGFAWNLGGWAALVLALPFALTYFPEGTAPARAAALVFRGPLAALRRRRFAVLVGLALAARAWVIVASPSPIIDVWSTLQDGADAFRHGKDPYAIVMSNPYGDGQIIDYYGYLPLVLLVTAPFRWIAGDVRVGLLVCEALCAWLLFRLAGGRRGIAELCALLHLYHPRGLFTLDRAWTEPISAALFLGLLLALRRRSLPASAILAGLFFASKQYLFLAAPIVAIALVVLAGGLGRAIGALLVAALAAAVVTLPIALWDTQAFLEDVVWFHLRRVTASEGSLTFSAALLRVAHAKMPPAVSGLAAVGAACFAPASHLRGLLARTSLAPAVAGASALAFLLSLPFQKQAWCNYYYLVGVMLLAAVAAEAGATGPMAQMKRHVVSPSST
jgi:hypothetical protein